MQLSIFRKFKGFLLLVVCIQALCMMGQGTLQDLVLCIGSDGHVAIEMAYVNGDCEFPAYDGKQKEGESIHAFVLVDHCGPCLDVGFDNDALFLQSTDQKQTVQILPSLFAFSFSPSISSSQSLHKIKSLYSPSSINTSLHSLHSVILLI